MTSSTGTDTTRESIFTWGAPPLKFGPGAVDEIGFDMAQYGARRVLILTDPRVSELGVPARIADSLARHGISSEIFDGCHVEPTDDSMDKAAGYAREQGPWDGFVAVGGGSSIDTAKAVNLLTTDEGSLMDYVNQPIGQGRTPRRQLKPLIAVPTTAGTGSESTAMCVLDVLSMRVKTGFGVIRGEERARRRYLSGFQQPAQRRRPGERGPGLFLGDPKRGGLLADHLVDPRAGDGAGADSEAGTSSRPMPSTLHSRARMRKGDITQDAPSPGCLRVALCSTRPSLRPTVTWSR